MQIQSKKKKSAHLQRAMIVIFSIMFVYCVIALYRINSRLADMEDTIDNMESSQVTTDEVDSAIESALMNN